jgi:serine/threonine protein kinase
LPLITLFCLLKGGDLFDAIAAAGKFSEPEAKRMTSDLASALSYLHSLNIVHRDVKPENLFVSFSPLSVANRVVERWRKILLYKTLPIT